MSAITMLGIDIGTSSVKCSVLEVIDKTKFQLFSSAKSSYVEKTIQNATTPGYSQQNVREIVRCLQEALSKLDRLDRVEHIVFSCQMHGIVLWNREKLFHKQQNATTMNFDYVSDLYDWTDLRCDENFLATLPASDSCASNSVQPCSGYGNVTLFWLQRNQPELLEKFDSSSTIGDFVASLFTSTGKPFISTHNAHSWAYFEPLENCWSEKLLENTDFPIHLLPDILQPGTIVGCFDSKVKNIFKNIPEAVPVSVCIGDLQAIMFYALRDNPEALVLNMGTSAQLCRIEQKFFKNASIRVDPFYGDKYLAVAASLNGGNVLQKYVDFLKEIVHSLAGTELSTNDVWSKLNLTMTKTPEAATSSSIRMKSTLFGERHEPNSNLTLTNVRHSFPTLTHLTQTLADSLIENLLAMMNVEREVSGARKQSLVCTGSVAMRNRYIQRALERCECFDEIHFIGDCDAEVGAALFQASSSSSMA